MDHANTCQHRDMCQRPDDVRSSMPPVTGLFSDLMHPIAFLILMPSLADSCLHADVETNCR